MSALVQKADMALSNYDVCFVQESGHSVEATACLLMPIAGAKRMIGGRKIVESQDKNLGFQTLAIQFSNYGVRTSQGAKINLAGLQ